MRRSEYDDDFYTHQGPGSTASAKAIVPLLIRLCGPGSVLDVGCGAGGWLREFERCGVHDYLGIDGHDGSSGTFALPPNRYRKVNLCECDAAVGRFDIALCLEVAEHLPETTASRLVSFLVSSSPIIVFSAAIPGQGGLHHSNEQWPSYWADHFQQHRYDCADLIRPTIWTTIRLTPGIARIFCCSHHESTLNNSASKPSPNSRLNGRCH
jgi:SAM-dependent methyltransferase